MRCHICDSNLPQPHFNTKYVEFDPCDTCLEVIEAAVGDFVDKASAPEDAWSEGDKALWDYYFPESVDPYEGIDDV